MTRGHGIYGNDGEYVAMYLQLIPGFSKTVKTTSQSRVPSNEVRSSVYASAKTSRPMESKR